MLRVSYSMRGIDLAHATVVKDVLAGLIGLLKCLLGHLIASKLMFGLKSMSD